MAVLRAFAEDDIPAVAALFGRAFPEQRETSRTGREAYFREIFFNNPWHDPDLPSWVAEEDGRVAGFAGVMARRMHFRGQSIRVAVGCQFMVDPNRRHGLTALQLARAALSGPQDLFIADGANNLSQQVWTGLGGTIPLLYNLHWTRPLRPARYILSLLGERIGSLRTLTFAARPLGALVDALSIRLRPNRFHRTETGLPEEALDPATMLTHLSEVMNGSALQPAYDARSLAWLLEQASRKKRHGALRARAVFDGKGPLIGWYIYYVQAGGLSEVVQIAARDGWFDRVLRRLLADAWRQGVAAVRGRLDPHHLKELSDRHCWLRQEGPCVLIHSRHADVLAAIRQGDAFLSRLEGEWWLRFLDE